MGSEVLVWILKVGGLALLGWGAWLCVMGRERRGWRDRRSEPRGGRRSMDARTMQFVRASAANAPSVAGTAAEQAARRVA
ncbi:MAG TPA: hypothetical protein VFB08_11165 [Burkholderiales bacterium]|nr:hypothetical protein [Burkholderiales bacterium]